MTNRLQLFVLYIVFCTVNMTLMWCNGKHLNMFITSLLPWLASHHTQSQTPHIFYVILPLWYRMPTESYQIRKFWTSQKILHCLSKTLIIKLYKESRKLLKAWKCISLTNHNIHLQILSSLNKIFLCKGIKDR